MPESEKTTASGALKAGILGVAATVSTAIFSYCGKEKELELARAEQEATITLEYLKQISDDSKVNRRLLSYIEKTALNDGTKAWAKEELRPIDEQLKKGAELETKYAAAQAAADKAAAQLAAISMASAAEIADSKKRLEDAVAEANSLAIQLRQISGSLVSDGSRFPCPAGRVLGFRSGRVSVGATAKCRAFMDTDPGRLKEGDSGYFEFAVGLEDRCRCGFGEQSLWLGPEASEP